MMTRTKTLSLCVAVLSAILLGSCSGGDGSFVASQTAASSSSVANQWSALALTLIRTTPGFSPPVASRALGYAGVALYETVVPGMPGYESLAGKLNGLPPLPPADTSPGVQYHWPAAANAAMASISRFLFSNTSAGNMTAINDLEATLAAQFQAEAGSETFARSVARGQAIAQAIHDWSLSDGGAFGHLTNASPGYVPPVGPGLWVPTPPAFAPALQATWGENRTFVLPSGASCAAGPHPTFSTDPASAFYAEAVEVQTTGNNLTPEQMEIANFWADGAGTTATPPGHWFSILNQIAERDDLDLAVVAEAQCKLGLAVADGFIVCWNAKFLHNLMRPVTYIQANIQPGWTSFIGTPQFPEYTSGHSVQSGAAATVLTEMFGDDFAFTDDTHASLSFPSRSFNSFWDAANEAAISRLYGGIHFRSGIEVGVECGRAVGHAVNAIRFRMPAVQFSQHASTFDGELANEWFDLSRELIRTTPGYSPPVAARALGCMGLCLYESVVHGMPGYRSLAGGVVGLTSLPQPRRDVAYHWPSVANAAMASTLKKFFPAASPTNVAAIDALEAQTAAAFAGAAPSAVIDRSIDFGRETAAVMHFFARSDGGHNGQTSNFPTSYVPPVGPGLWVPTAPAFSIALQPFWGGNRCFALEAGDAADPGAPPPFSTSTTSLFYQEGLEVHDVGVSLTPEQIDIALWWADGGATFTPPGHSISWASIALRQTGAKLDRAAEVYAKVGLAVSDGFVSCWNAKFKYNLLRPITYIQANIDAVWTPLIATPPFPEYTSGHSTQSGAAAFVLTQLFGEGFAFVDDTNSTLLSMPSRSFGSFTEAAEEAAISRLYGGIHFRAAIEIGVAQGVAIGKKVVALPFNE
jgi:hypothetical protein